MPNKKNTLCWYCTRTIDGSQYCPWVDDGVPVKGWEVSDVRPIEPGRQCFGIQKTCNVDSCPLFIRRTNSIILSEYINVIAEEIGVNYSTAHSQPKALLQKYTKITGKQHPQWVIDELYS